MVRLSHEDSGSRGRFVIYDDDVFAGEMTYTRRNDGNIVIDHTGVESAFGGKGYGGLLLAEAVGYARREGI
ncbi:MAG: GNAT family N-acetyltransferase, partial [Bacteroidota bacterium]